MITSKTYIVLSIITLLFFSSCESKNKEGVPIIPIDKMVGLLTEIQLLEAYATIPSVNQPYVRDSLAYYYKSIFDKFEVTQEDFYNSMQEYGKNPITITEIYDLVSEALQEKELVFSNFDATTVEPIMAFSINQMSEILYQTPLADQLLLINDTLDINSFRDRLFVYIDQNDSLLNTFGVNASSFKYTFIINTSQKILLDQVLLQVRELDLKQKSIK